MKEFDLGGITYLRPVPEGTSEWYYALDYPDGDLYEAEEIYASGKRIEGSCLYLIHFPDGEVTQPLVKAADVAIGEPVYHGQTISFPAVEFANGVIRIYSFDCAAGKTEERAALPLSAVKDCYNLRLHEHPLTLTRQANDGIFELLWPDRKTIAVEPKESFFYRDGDRLFFSTWYEDPDYRVETIIRSAATGAILQKLPGDVHIMPDGELWHLK